jgi:hypothetical protein
LPNAGRLARERRFEAALFHDDNGDAIDKTIGLLIGAIPHGLVTWDWHDWARQSHEGEKQA